MSGIEAIILGIIQGLTEFIPISSSGHLVLAQNFLRGASQHMFLEFINIGTLLALLWFFRAKIAAIVRDMVHNKNYRLARNIILTSIPAGIIGFTMAGLIADSALLASIGFVLVPMTLVGILMVVLERLPRASEVEEGAELSPLRAFLIGCAQAAALIPGVSRSGATIIAGRLSGMKPAPAAEYSFLASIPIMLGVTLRLMIAPEAEIYFIDNMWPLIFGNMAAFISGVLAVGFLMRYLSKHSLEVFGWYRIILAAVVLVVILVQ